MTVDAYDEVAFREAVRKDLREEADYGTDDPMTVTVRVWKQLYGALQMSDALCQEIVLMVEDEWDWWFEEGPIE